MNLPLTILDFGKVGFKWTLMGMIYIILEVKFNDQEKTRG
jgi:hypothetical protein